MARKARVERNTAETQIKLSLTLDGAGRHKVATSVPFLDHMLSLMARHGHFDLTVAAKGDIEVDYHHTVEDVGIVLGQAFKQAMGDMKGIRRYGSAKVPMDEALAEAVVDISGRPGLVYNVKLPKGKVGEFDVELAYDFFKALTNHAGITLHVNVPYGGNLHHIIEAVFKAFGRAMDEAAGLDARARGVPSTKGML
ncbi:MAG TPA: imidazoleglycerol-phosphate dehydratase HisB [Nitrospirota bacterium]|nr:imidazoleglycerol-phosphate dehydratase HisB [Nitrospirota bacterium]